MKSAEYEAMFRVEETHWWYRALHQLLLDSLDLELPDWREKRLLDAGCGTGAILKRLGRPDRNIGVDIAPEALSFCRKRGLENVQQADISALPFPNDTFDAVICSSVLYHQWVVDVEVALAELRRVLRPAGLLFLVLPAFRFLHSAHDEAVLTARRFARPEVRKLLRQSGFDVERLTYWTTFLFPGAVLARTLGVSDSGRDFERDSSGIGHHVFSFVMALERRVLRKVSLPFGVALLAIARKAGDGMMGDER